MFVLRRLPAFLALLMLGALSLRLGLGFLPAIVLTLAMVVALFLPWNWTRGSVASLLWGGALAWVGMTLVRVQQRLQLGEPWMRLAMILIGVALFTAWSAWMLKREPNLGEARG